MAFEKVEKTGRGGGASQPLLSIRKSGGIGINSKAMMEFFEDATHANIFYDQEENEVGIEPLEGNGPDSYKISQTENSGGLAASGFLNSHGLIPDVTTRYAPELQSVEVDGEEHELVVIDLDDAVGTYGSPRSEEE